MSDTLKLTTELINRKTLTPDDNGCQKLIAERLKKNGFRAEHLRFDDVDNLWVTHGNSGPLFVFAGHTDTVPVGPIEKWNTDTEQDLIYECETQSQNSNDFALNSSKACYKGSIFTFDFPIPADTTLTTKDFRFYEGEDDIIGKTPVSVSYSDGIVTINLGTEKYYNASRSDLVPDDGSTETSQVTIKATPSLAGVTQDDYKYNYSKLGETWSTPRVFRIPDPDSPNSGFSTDIYTFVMGGGMGSAVGRSGSNVFVVDLEDREFPGAIAGAKQNHGPISIIDTEYTSSTPNGSDVANAIPSSPVVITPDNTLGIEWRGAMVYVNDCLLYTSPSPRDS